MTEEAAATIETPADQPEPDEFALVEIFGHRRLFGRIKEVERFGAKLLRVDIPKDDNWDAGYETQFYAGSAIFSLTPTDERTVLRNNKAYHPAGRYLAPPDDDDDFGEDDDDMEDMPDEEDPNQEKLPI